MQSVLLFLPALAGLATANPMATTQQKCAAPVVSACKTNAAATPYCSSLINLWPAVTTTTWTSTPPVVTDTAYATDTSYTTSTYVLNVTTTSTVTTYPWSVYTCTPSPASSATSSGHHKRVASASPVPCPQALTMYSTSAVKSACSCLNLPTQTNTVTATTVLPPVTTTTTLTLQTTLTLNTTRTALYTVTSTSTAPTFTHTVLSTFSGNFTTTTNNTSFRSSPPSMGLYPSTDFPTSQGFTQLSTGSSLCANGAAYAVGGIPFGTCSSFNDCMNICAAYSEGILAGSSTASLCRGVTYGMSGRNTVCLLKSSVPGNATTASCGQVNTWLESAILELPW